MCVLNMPFGGSCLVMYQENLCNMIKVSYPISQNFSFQYSLILKLRKSNIKEALIIVFCVLS
jgi:hypothetical protein